MKPKKFMCTKTVDEIRQQCDAAGIQFDTKLYDKGADHIAIRAFPDKREWIVLFNAFNGRFFGTAPGEIEFSSDDKLDGTPWFDALLQFFYLEE